MKLKAFNTFPGRDPHECGCLLVFAMNRYQAQKMGCAAWPGNEYLTHRDFRAWRVPKFDKYAENVSEPTYFETNDETPEPFYSESV